MNSLRYLVSSILAVALLFAGGNAPAQNYPNRTMRIVVPFAAGGAVDTLARLVGAKLAETLKQPVVVDNRPGAGGNIGAEVVAKAAPDGYTILLTTNGHAISPALYRKLPFDAVKDFIPVTQVTASTTSDTPVSKLDAVFVGEPSCW